MSLETEVQELTKATNETTKASQDLSQEVAGKMGEIDSELEAKKREFDEYLVSQNPIFNLVQASKGFVGLRNIAAFYLEPGESKVILKNNSSYTNAMGLLTMFLNHGTNTSINKFVDFSGYGLKEFDIDGATNNRVALSIIRSTDQEGTHLSSGQCELVISAPEGNVGNTAVYANFVAVSAISSSVTSDILS